MGGAFFVRRHRETVRSGKRILGLSPVLRAACIVGIKSNIEIRMAENWQRDEGQLATGARLTLSNDTDSAIRGDPKMSKLGVNLPTSGYAIIIDGLVKTEFATLDGVEIGARDLKRRFPMLQVEIYDAAVAAARDVDAP